MTSIAKLGATCRHGRRFLTRHGGVTLLLRSAVAVLALGAIIAPASAKPFQQYLNGVCGATLCTIDFAKVPAGKRLDVTNVSCYVRLRNVTGRPAIRAAQLLVIGANPNNTLNAVTLVPHEVSNLVSEIVFSADHPIAAFARSKQRFRAYVEINFGAFSQVACQISGDMVRAA